MLRTRLKGMTWFGAEVETAPGKKMPGSDSVLPGMKLRRARRAGQAAAKSETDVYACAVTGALPEGKGLAPRNTLGEGLLIGEVVDVEKDV